METSLKTKAYKILVFTLDELACALHISNFVRVIRAVEINKLPKAPEIIKGIIYVRGKIIPVLDIRKRFGHLRREVKADDRIIIAETGKRKVAFFADTVSDIEELEPTQFENSGKLLSSGDCIKGVAGVKNDLILIHDLDEFLSLEEEKALEEALEAKAR